MEQLEKDLLKQKLRNKINNKKTARTVNNVKNQLGEENLSKAQEAITNYDRVVSENKKLKDLLNQMLNPTMKEALENYDKLVEENKMLKAKLNVLEVKLNP